MQAPGTDGEQHALEKDRPLESTEVARESGGLADLLRAQGTLRMKARH